VAGSVTVGKKAAFIVTNKVMELGFIPYFHHTPFIDGVLA